DRDGDDGNDDDFEYDLEKQIDQGYNDEILDNHIDDADPQPTVDLDNEGEGENDEGEDDEEQAQGNNHRRVTMMDFFAYRLQYRIGDSSEYML
ncbi:hypothetical protein BGX23_005751, partial [Mortierella sp. AD031]